MDPGEERIDLYQEIEAQIIEDAPWIPIYFYTTIGVEKPFVNNLNVIATGPMPLNDVWLDPDYQ